MGGKQIQIILAQGFNWSTAKMPLQSGETLQCNKIQWKEFHLYKAILPPLTLASVSLAITGFVPNVQLQNCLFSMNYDNFSFHAGCHISAETAVGTCTAS